MKDQKKEKKPVDIKKVNQGTIVSGIGFLLYLGARVLELELVADICAIVFAVIAMWTFFAAAEGRGKDKEAFSYNILWGTGSLALLLLACAVLTVKTRLGL